MSEKRTLLRAITDASPYACLGDHAKEVSETVAMVDALERARAELGAKWHSLPANVYVLGDGTRQLGVRFSPCGFLISAHYSFSFIVFPRFIAL